MAMQRISFYKFVLPDPYDLNLIVSRLLENSDEKSHFVFNEQGIQYLSGCYLVQQTRTEITYNMQENKFETLSSNKLVIVKFDIDISKSVLTIWGNKSVAQRLITLITQVCDNRVIIDIYHVDFKQMLMKISKLENVTFSKMKLENVLIDLGIIASCNVPLQNLNNAKGLIMKYSENVSQLSLTLGKSFENNSVQLTFFSSGSIVIYKDRDSIPDEIITEIQEIAIG